MSVIQPRNFWHWLAVGFGSGLAPKAPGTVGTIAALPLVMAAWYALPLGGFVLLCAALTVIGSYACDVTAKAFYTEDPGYVVIDEWAGLFVSVIAVPFTWWNVLLAFVLFRVFDIVKPWPVSWADKSLKGGFGIMADDLIAGGLTCVCLHGLSLLLA